MRTAQLRRSRPIAFIAAALVAASLAALPRAAGAAEAAPFTAFTAGPGQVVISQGGEDYLRLGLAAWGPKWAWTGIDGKVANQQGAAVGALTAKLGGSGVTLRVDFRAARAEPRKLQVQYQVQAQADTDLTLACVELGPGKTFEGRDALVEAQGKETKVRCPFERRGLGTGVTAIRMTDSTGGVAVIRLDPACDITSDGAARLMIAQDKLAATDVRKVNLTIELPAELSWYATAADLPAEPGADAWYPWQATGAAKDSLLSLADWLDAPAGKFGRITRQGENLMYHGQPLKLWGLNLCYGACAPEKALADKRAALYRNYGLNAVRLHKYADGAGWSGIQAKDSCVEFEPAALDRMDYQVAKFKEAGIYVNLSAHFGTPKLGPADKQFVPWMEELGAMRNNRIEVPHSAVHYSPDLQRVQILQAVHLLKHKNPYTGLTYAEDPVVGFLEIINEQSILFYTSTAPLKASKTLRTQVGQRFGAWLKQKYGSQEKLAAAWGKGSFDIFANDGFRAEGGESLDRDNILPIGNPWYWDPDQLAGSQAPRKQRHLDTLTFLYTLQCEFYDRYVKTVREAGYPGEIIGSNWQAGRAFSHFANLHADYQAGTIDRHNYFGSKANDTMFRRAGSGLLSTGMQQVSDRPFMLSEWIHTYPNEYGVEGPAILGAYGLGLQGWDVSFMFQNGDTGTFSAKIGRDQWDVTAPQVLGVFPAVARQILRGDVRESPVLAVRNVHMPSALAGKLSFDDKVVQGYDNKELDSSKVPAQALAVARSVVTFTEQYADTPVFDLKPYVKDGALVSATGQLRWQEAGAPGGAPGGGASAASPGGSSGGFFTMDTPGTQAVVGFASGRKCDLANVTIEPRTRFAAIYITARQRDQTIATARELLIVAMARARNTGMKVSPAGDRILTPGAGPILMEPVQAKLTLRKPGATVIALDQDGRPTTRTVPVEQGAFTIDSGRDQSPYYLVRY